MRLPFTPREEKFFDLFQKGAKNLVAAANRLLDFVENYEDAPNKAKQVTELEHQGDFITHQIMERLHRTFVTPLDREDIALLAHTLDDVVDFIEAASTAMVIYRIPQPTPRARQLASIIVKMAAEIDIAMQCLLQRGRMKEILEHCIELNRLENEADDVLRSALVELFEDTTEAVEIIKWREIYEHLETATDRGEDVANVLEGVVLKHA